MSNLFRIRGLDLADGDSIPAFIHFCQDRGVSFFIDKVCGPNGFPTCNLVSGDWETLAEVLLELCGGDEKAAADLEDMIEKV